MAAASILLFLPEKSTQLRVAGILSQAGHRVRKIDSAAGLQACLGQDRHGHDLLIADEEADGLAGRSFVDAVSRLRHQLPLIVVAAHGTVQRAVAAVQAGAGDYLLHSASEEMILSAVQKICARNNADPPVARPEKEPGQPTIVSRAPVMAHLLATAARVAPSAATVLIQGESGTGKEMLARYIHRRSTRYGNPFIAMNCAALPDSLAESELFGFEKWAFTGALHRKAGKFELAHTGTLLLDEIGELAQGLQAKLLRVLQEKEVDPIGGQRPVSIDVRVIATTNCDLGAMAREGRFRADLYHRLRIIPFEIPPLRCRRDDIPLLVDFFMAKHPAADTTRPAPRMTPEALQLLTSWDWPGNVRELENAIQRALLICDEQWIRPHHLLLETGLSGGAGAQPEPLVGSKVRELEKRLIEQTLGHVNQNRTLAAQMLGISIRTLRNKLREYREAEEAPPQRAAGDGT